MDSNSVEEAKSLGNNAFKNGDFAMAIALYTHALELVARDGDTGIAHMVHANRSAAHARVGDYAAALDDADAAVALAPDWPRGHQRRGTALLRLGRARAALQAFTRAAELKPDDKDVASGLADARTTLAAAQAFLGPAAAAAAQGRDHVAALLGTADEAVVARVVALGDEPALLSTADLLDPPLVDALAVLLGGRAVLDQELSSLSAKQQEQQNKEEETAETLLRVAEENVQRGTLWEAADALERAARLAPREARVYARLADVYEAIGDTRRAVRWCRRGLVCCGSVAGATEAVRAALARTDAQEDDAAVLYAARLHLAPDGRGAAQYAATAQRLFGAGRLADALECFAAAEAAAAHSGDRGGAGRWAGAQAAALVRLQRAVRRGRAMCARVCGTRGVCCSAGGRTRRAACCSARSRRTQTTATAPHCSACWTCAHNASVWSVGKDERTGEGRMGKKKSKGNRKRGRASPDLLPPPPLGITWHRRRRSAQWQWTQRTMCCRRWPTSRAATTR